VLTGEHQKHANKGLAEAIQRNIELTGLPQWTENENNFAKALRRLSGQRKQASGKAEFPQRTSGNPEGRRSTDVVEVSLIAPTATLNFPGQYRRYRTSLVNCNGRLWVCSMEGLNAGSKVNAGTALDLLTDENF
jgi:aminobenzoyl-glutamate utilization protein B